MDRELILPLLQWVIVVHDFAPKSSLRQFTRIFCTVVAPFWVSQFESTALSMHLWWGSWCVSFRSKSLGSFFTSCPSVRQVVFDVDMEWQELVSAEFGELGDLGKMRKNHGQAPVLFGKDNLPVDHQKVEIRDLGHFRRFDLILQLCLSLKRIHLWIDPQMSTQRECRGRCKTEWVSSCEICKNKQTND